MKLWVKAGRGQNMASKDYRITDDSFKIKDAPTAIPKEYAELTKDEIKGQIAGNVKQLQKMQQKLYDQRKYGVVVLFQAMDAAGKDSMIKHIFSGVNPVGFKVANFKQPNSVELSHDYLWRINESLPRRGVIGVFNRSYYEDVLVSRVHPEILLKNNLPQISSVDDVTEKFWESRYEDIRQYEAYLNRQGYIIYKFFLHVSKDEQRNRFQRRIDIKSKNWKFSAADIRERRYWDSYQKAYQKAIRATSTKKEPWYVIPSDSKWVSRLIVSDILTQQLSKLPLDYPDVNHEQRSMMKEALQELKDE